MDYDDNDFQSENHQLTSETNNKYPPALQPYALPKFDFDDSLNGHLRFDSLVETEDFLGIEGDEDSNWIEDFSQGGSGVVFSSSAAESCAIPRHNNVWSEATSTESVEMLLKSLGQDEMNAGEEDTVKKSDVSDEVGCLVKQMEPSEKSLPKEEGVSFQPNPTVEETPVESSLSKEEEQPLAQEALPTVDHESPDVGKTTPVSPLEIATGEAAVTVGPQNSPGDTEEMLVDLDKLGTEITERHLEPKEHDASKMEIDCIDETVQSHVTCIAELNSEETLQKSNISDSMQDYHGDPSCDPQSASVEVRVDSQLGSSSRSEKVDNMADLVSTQMESPELLVLDGRSSTVKVTSAHASSTIELSLDLAKQVKDAENSPSEERPELVSHESVEIIANECEASFQSETVAQTHLVETSEAVAASAVNTTHTDGISCKRSDVDDDDASHHGPATPKRGTELAFNASDVDHDAGSSQNISEGNVLEPFTSLSKASASKPADSEPQSDSIPGTVMDMQEGQEALPHDADESNHQNQDKTNAVSVASAADLSILKTSSALIEEVHVSESEKDSSCKPDHSSTLLPVDVYGAGSQMHEQTSMHNEDTHNVEHSSVTDGSKKPEVKDDTGASMLHKSEDSIQLEILDSESKKTSDTELIPEKDNINDQPDASPLKNLGIEVKNDVLEDDNTAESVDNNKAGTSILQTKGDVIKFADSSPSAAPNVTEREKVVADLINPSTSSPITSRPSETLQVGSETKSNRDPEVRIIPCLPIEAQMAKRNDTPAAQTSLPSDTTSLADPSIKTGSVVSRGATNLSGAVPVSPNVLAVPSSSSMSEKRAARSSKGTTERKPRRSSKAAGKETYKKGNAMTPSKQLQSGPDTSAFTQSSTCTSPFTQYTEKQPYHRAESPAVKPFGNIAGPTSSLPDLNSSALPSLLQRPFTDLQQVQLRAQIFVYGALIQGTAPDEAYMISAFGGPDGGKSIWEKPWHACIEKAQKSHASTPETPLQPRSGKMATPSVGRASSKEIPSVNPIVPFSSPLWSLPTPRDALHQSSSLLRGFATDHQTPPLKNIVGHSNAPWISPSPYHSPWLATSQTTAFDVGSRFSVFPISEAASFPHSGAKNLQSTSVVKETSSLFGPKGAIASPSQHSTESKSRKRKKVPVSEEPGSSMLLNSQNQTEPVLSPIVGCIPTSGPFINASPANLVSITTAPMNLVSMFSPEKPISSLSSPGLSKLSLASGNLEFKQRSVLAEDAIGKLKEAMGHAEDASALAAAAVSHSQYLWKQVGQQKKAGLEPETQGRLASAAAAIAAASAVAKAAAAAANVAANAALQAKLMAEEASSDQVNELSKLDGSKMIGSTTPASVLKGNCVAASSSSVLTAARDAAKKRVEAATAATKQAENIDAIVKAAELAAEAVSQAEKLVSMGDPLSLNEIVEASPHSYQTHAHHKGGTSEKNKALATSLGDGHTNPLNAADSVSSLRVASGKNTEGHQTADLAVVLEPEATIKSTVDTQTDSEQIIGSVTENDIKEGCGVEVFKEGPGLRSAWYSANVISLKDDKAYVCYTDLSSENGADKLKEWVAVRGDGDMAPTIRSARSVTAMPFEGTRKRRRAGDRVWTVGNKVDAWVHDSWWEGVVTEKNKKDETTLTVHFPVQGEKLMVKSWNLRPSLVWKDGRWSECSSSEAIISSSHEGDTPKEKRPRLGSPAPPPQAQVKESDPKTVETAAALPQTALFEMNVSERTFSIGADHKPDAMRMKRTGLQKQGSRVVFGVPKPGKKRKFMDVSKHYVVSEAGGKAREHNEPPKSMIPQCSGTRAWRNASKSDPKEKQTALSKRKMIKPASKPRAAAAAAKTVALKEDSQSGDETGKNKSSVSSDVQSGEVTVTGGSSSLQALRGERTSKGTVPPRAALRLGKIEEDKVLSDHSSKASDGVEAAPRRSNRRIQPTSRLLEGLQSSMMSTKMQSGSSSVGKGQPSQSKSSGSRWK